MRINWFGLIAGILTLLVIVLSVYMPWWVLSVGDNLFKINASPIYTNFGLLGDSFTIPILLALNISSILLFTAAGIIMLIYSFVPTKPYAIHLLNFSYKKPLWAIIGFIVALLTPVGIAAFLGVNIPLMGTSTISLPESLTFGMGINFKVFVTGGFLLPFWLAVSAAVLCIGAKLYHGRAAKVATVKAVDTKTVDASDVTVTA
jgi:hypothetical protein